MSVQLFISGKPVDLFNDESIEITLQARNYGDLNKVFSDYSQPFNIPATKNNNELLRHWYEQGNLTGINAHNGIVATLAISGIPNDRLGLLELVNVSIKEGQPQSYQVVFYGLQRNIANEISEKRLAEVDWSGFNHVANYANIRNSWAGNFMNGDVLYPVFDYGQLYIETSGSLLSSQNIKLPDGAIALENLRPAFLLRKMLVKCFEDVGVNVVGAWTTDNRLQNLFCLPMEKAGRYSNPAAGVRFTMRNTEMTVLTNTNSGSFTKVIGFDEINFDPFSAVDLSAQTYTAPLAGNYTFNFTGFITTLGFTPATITLHLIKNGAIAASGNPFTTNINAPYANSTFAVTLAAGDVVWLGLSSNISGAISIFRESQFKLLNAPAEDFIAVDARELMPDIKVKDFIQSCVDSFNLVFTPLNENTLSIDFLQGYYTETNNQDITPYVNTEAYNFEKIDIFREIDFKHDQKNDLQNQNFRKLSNRDYGSVRYFPESDFATSTLNIKTAFQVLPQDFIQTHSNSGDPISNTTKELFKAITEDKKPMQIPLMLFYLTGQRTVDAWYLFDKHLPSTRTAQIQTNWPICRTFNARPSTSQSLSVAFGFEGVADQTNETTPIRTLLQEYWKEYLNNTFDATTRRLKVSARLPKDLLYNIKLNTILNVNGQQYAIEKMIYKSGSDIVDFHLVTWRIISPDTVGRIASTGNEIIVREVSPFSPRFNGDDIYVTLTGGSSVLEVQQPSDSRDIAIQLSDLQGTVNTIIADTGDKHYTHVQSVASDSWEVTHNLNKLPSVQVTTSANDIIIGDITHTNVNSCVISFRAAFSGKATFN